MPSRLIVRLTCSEVEPGTGNHVVFTLPVLRPIQTRAKTARKFELLLCRCPVWSMCFTSLALGGRLINRLGSR